MSLIEGTLLTRRPAEVAAIPDEELDEEPTRPPRRAWTAWIVGAGVGGVLFLALLTLAVAAGVAAYVAQPFGAGANDATSIPAPGPALPLAPTADGEAAVDSVSRPSAESASVSVQDAEPDSPSPTAIERPRARTTGRTSTGTPAAVSTVAETPPMPPVITETPPPRVVLADGRVRLETVGGEVSFELVRDGKSYNPGSVPPGRYTMRAFGGDLGMIEVPPGGTVQIRCNALRQTCVAP